MTPLETLLATTLGQPVPPEITAMAAHVAGRHGDVLAVLAYGSCLRGVATSESLIDLYVLTRDLRGVSRNIVSRIGCRLAPPNVYYAECDWNGRRYRAKYAVLPIDLFHRWMTADNPYFWARFSQPSALVHAADETSRRTVIAAVAAAARTMFAHARALAPPTDEELAVWTAGFRATYGTELRAESGGTRAAHVVEANAGYYRALSDQLAGTAPLHANWAWRSFTGKLWAATRLIKASFTFAGGADYLVWKIARHTGHKITLTAWQRRHPVIAGLILLPRLLRRGTVK
ncbi:MAG: hypothetical protein KDK89_11275 [Alphaproteobacteria bacterium]|nr:hypothetical protein [Alphaproteobacteria bacterium]